MVLYDDDDILEFMTDVSKFNPNILEIYHSLAAIVEKTDYWRYLIMYYFGGVYIDSDVQALQGIESWPFWSSSNITAVVGIEFILKEEDILPYEATSTHQYLQFVLVGDKRHDLFRVAVRKVGENVNRELEGHHRYPEKYNSQMRVLFRTGPGAWTDSVWEYFRSYNFREFDVKANDVIGSVYVADKLVLQKQLVLHHQRGSWKHNPTP